MAPCTMLHVDGFASQPEKFVPLKILRHPGYALVALSICRAAPGTPDGSAARPDSTTPQNITAPMRIWFVSDGRTVRGKFIGRLPKTCIGVSRSPDFGRCL